MTVEIDDNGRNRALEFLLANERRLPDMRVIRSLRRPLGGVVVEVDDDALEPLTDALEYNGFDFEVSD